MTDVDTIGGWTPPAWMTRADTWTREDGETYRVEDGTWYHHTITPTGTTWVECDYPAMTRP